MDAKDTKDLQFNIHCRRKWHIQTKRQDCIFFSKMHISWSPRSFLAREWILFFNSRIGQKGKSGTPYTAFNFQPWCRPPLCSVQTKQILHTVGACVPIFDSAHSVHSTRFSKQRHLHGTRTRSKCQHTKTLLFTHSSTQHTLLKSSYTHFNMVNLCMHTTVAAAQMFVSCKRCKNVHHLWHYPLFTRDEFTTIQHSRRFSAETRQMSKYS